jgi:hypothetical protein
MEKMCTHQGRVREVGISFSLQISPSVGIRERLGSNRVVLPSFPLLQWGTVLFEESCRRPKEFV